MAYAVVAFDGTDEGAAARRAAARDRHLALAAAMARDGRLALSLPLHGADGRSLGSLAVLDVPDRTGMDAYLRTEPFVQGEVWKRHAVHPARIAPLPYQPLVPPGAGMPTRRTHTVILAMDGTDPDAPARRLKVREAHLARVRPMARDGTLAIGMALLDPTAQRMIGSIAVVRHDSDDATRAWIAADPYGTGDVWRDISLYATRFAPLPYQPWPETFHA